jgi:protocatechuate 3,4-dioxygenase beta subunit
MKLLIFILVSLNFFSCHGQSDQQNNSSDKTVGGPFENGDFIFIGMPNNILSIDTSAGWNQNGQKLLITGTIFKRDGKTPAPDVVLYYYHTDVNGYYADREGLDRRVVRHGYIRGWVKSDKNGKYSIYTVRPAPYPNSNFSAHIHPTIKEPGINEYYIDEFVFDDDILLTTEKRKALENRGGSGILRTINNGDLQVAEHNIILGLNIPNYPDYPTIENKSGLEIGEDSPSFMPYHAWGPDKNSRACPVCKYGRYHGIIYFVGNKPDWEDINSWISVLEKESEIRGKYLKVYFVYGNENEYNKSNRISELESMGKALNIKHTALTFVPSFSDKQSEINLNKINQDVENTFIIYRNRSIIDKYVNLEPTEDNFNKIRVALDESKSEYFELE